MGKEHRIKTRFSYEQTFTDFKRNSKLNGGLAQLARALRWQRRGHRFDSDILHKKSSYNFITAFFNLISSIF